MCCDVFPPLLLLLFVSAFGTSHGCLQDPASAYRFTGAVCRLTYPAAVVLNEKTTKVIEAAFQHARYPSVKGENVNVAQSIDFEIDSQIDLGINPKLYCGGGKVAADTSDCYLNFHKLHLHLQGDKEPNWLKKLFTNFITFTVRLVIKGQICNEINKVANILADFIQDTAEHFLSDGDISVDIGVTASPVITANYIESYHKGLTNYNNTSAVISDSVFHPSQLTEHRMLYFWVSDQVFNPMMTAAHHDGRFKLNISGAEITELFTTSLTSTMPQSIRKCLFESDSPELRVWSSSVPFLNTSTLGTTVWAKASGQLHCGNQDTPIFFFETDLSIDVTASYADKKLSLQGKPSAIHVHHYLPLENLQLLEFTAHLEFIKEAVEKIGIPKVLSVLETELTRLLDKQGTNLFDISNPEVLPRDGFVVIQMDFGFPHHLLVEFLKKTLQ
ncbi:hypothetical protein PAMP_019337 [Pampus punctatissimus]